MLHIAEHHVVPGKKQWTWGNGEFGQAWDRQLTDEDGPYIELMCGAYTDNQPDFSWIQPGEEKSFTQIFMPYKKIGPACNANEHAVINLEVQKEIARIGVYCSAPRTGIVRLTCKGMLLYEKRVRLDPEKVLIDSLALPANTRPQDLTLSVFAGKAVLLTFTPLPDDKPEIPPRPAPARAPEEIETNEELFINGQHLEQYRHATYAPEPYYLEAIRRDPGDSRCNNAMGLLLYRRGKFSEAEAYFRKALQRLTLRNPNPYDGEPYYNLGLALRMQSRFAEAYDAFYKAAWNAAWQDAAYFEIARLASRKGDFAQALDFAERSLSRNGRHHKARHLKLAVLRRVGHVDEARREASLSLAADPLEYGALWERFLLDGDPAFEKIVRSDPATFIELALDYAHAGLFDEAIQLLEKVPFDCLAVYTLGWVVSRTGQEDVARELFRNAASMPGDYCFPNRIEDVVILEAAQRSNPEDARAPYALGNFWYAHRRYEEAIACWERSGELDPAFATVQRNLGLAYFNKRSDPQSALACFERAFALNPGDARVFFELDQLYKQINRSPEERFAVMQQHPDLVEQRDDLSIEYITVLNLVGRPDEALQRLMQRIFHPWEGGEGRSLVSMSPAWWKLPGRRLRAAIPGGG